MSKKPFRPSADFLKAIPKTDLHVHLGGSLRLSTLIDFAKKQNVDLPSYTESGLMETVFKKQYSGLAEYLKAFYYTHRVMRDPESLEQIAYELAWDNFNEGVRYIEIRFAPQLNAHRNFTLEQVLATVHKGLERAQKEIHRSAGIASGKEPPFEFGIIGCAMRKFHEKFSDYFHDFIKIHCHTPLKELYPIASLELARALVEARDSLGLPVVGFDLAGEEKGWPAEDHKASFDFAHKNFLNKTVHAGEAFGPPSIFQAVTDLHADRIGHATHLFATEDIDATDPKAKRKYLDGLVQYLGERRITIEVCLTSNLQTIPSLTSISDHPAKKMLEHNLSVTFCTDNRLVSQTTVCNEIAMAQKHFQLDQKRLKDIIIYGFKRSFFPKSYREKRAYVYQVIDYYEAMEKKYLVG